MSKKRKTVQLAKDADQVLKRCRRLREKLIQQEKFASAEERSSEERPAGVPSSIVEVAELSGSEVLDGMENIAIGIAQQVLSKKGFSFDIPSRASSNQIYVKEWDRIVLGGKRSTRSFLNVKESRKSAITLRVLQLLHAGESRKDTLFDRILRCSFKIPSPSNYFFCSHFRSPTQAHSHHQARSLLHGCQALRRPGRVRRRPRRRGDDDRVHPEQPPRRRFGQGPRGGTDPVRGGRGRHRLHQDGCRRQGHPAVHRQDREHPERRRVHPVGREGGCVYADGRTYSGEVMSSFFPQGLLHNSFICFCLLLQL